MSVPGRVRYHHGDLRSALLREAAALIRESGIDALSLRSLSDRAGVSRSALYHHFRDKNDLLCAVAEQGFEELAELLERSDESALADLEIWLRGFVRAYIRFAADNVERYELMFGRAIWKGGRPSGSLKAVAYSAFRQYCERISSALALLGERDADVQRRLGQVSWATLHGLCRFMIDGIYVHPEDLDEISQRSVTLLIDGLSTRQAHEDPGAVS